MINYAEIEKKLEENPDKITIFSYGKHELGVYLDYSDSMARKFIVIDYTDGGTIYVIYYTQIDDLGYYDAWVDCAKWDTPKRLYHREREDRCIIQMKIFSRLPKYLGLK